MACAIRVLAHEPVQHFTDTFLLTTPESERKRPLGNSANWHGHRQEESAQKALAAGYQLKRGAAKPLLEVEMEPGQAVAWSLQVVHPFTVPAALPQEIVSAVHDVAFRPQEVLQHRAQALLFWEAEAHRLLPVTIDLIARQPDPHLRFLLRGGPDDQPAMLGQVCHIALYAAMLERCRSDDGGLPQRLLEGFNIVGPIEKSNRWPPFTKEQKCPPVQAALDRAWELRKKIISRVQSVPVSDNLIKIWQSTLEDCTEGSSVGPFETEQQVSEFLGCEDWIPTQRFEVVQKNKVRGCDSATTNMINQVTVITEKLQLPSTDVNVAALRLLKSLAPSARLVGWVLDERKAYRQVAVRPEQRKFSVICLKHPEKKTPSFFVMVGHSFGLVSAVYNYNRRSAAINEILVKLFKLVAFSFYDDKYGFETENTGSSAHLVAQSVHTWLGAKYDQKKLQLSKSPAILGVTYNLEQMQLEIKPERKAELIEELDQVLQTKLLDPGAAGKLKGKLMFGASQLWGKVGRAFLRAISERQYMRIAASDSLFKVDLPLELALRHWRMLVEEGPPRTIDASGPKKADVVVFTDGFTPDPRSHEALPDRVGAVMFDRRSLKPVQFTAVVPDEVKKDWIPRATQIIPIEMLAPILALSTFADRVESADVILLIDSEVVEAALIKGYSRKADVCSLVSLFWELALKLKVRIFIDRVSTDANPADWPSRDQLWKGEAVGWVTREVVWPVELK